MVFLYIFYTVSLTIYIAFIIVTLTYDRILMSPRDNIKKKT